MARPRKKSPLSIEDKEVVQIVAEYYAEADAAKRDRMRANEMNWNVYMGNIDWSHKVDGQSMEHLPKLANSVEQMTAFVKRALSQFGAWFSVELANETVLTSDQARALLARFLDTVVVARDKTTDFATLLGDGTKQALLESLLVFKVHGAYLTERAFRVEPGNLLAGVEPYLADDANKVWRLRIDLIPSEGYFPDPTGRNLYEIHELERDLSEVAANAEGDDAIYDPKVVEAISEDMAKEERKMDRARGKPDVTTPRRRKRVQLREMWGTLLDRDGKVVIENCVCTIANGKHLLRKPTPNPFWHRESPIVAAPLLRVPHTTWHKAIYDPVASLNLALNELYNLILDGGIASVWGVRQVRTDWLDDPRQVSNGIPQGATLGITADAPMGGKVVENVTTGQVPGEALAVFGLTDREAAQAGFSNDVRLGNLPQRQVKATELVQSEQNASILLDSFSGDLEREAIVPVLRKAWFTLLQFADDIPAQDVVDAVGVTAAFKLSQMSDAERFAALASGFKFKANGLSSTLAKAREFQKLMAMVQGVGTNPLLLQAFLKRFSGDKMLTHIMRSLNINPENLQMSPEEAANAEQTAGEVGQMAQLTGGGSPPSAGQTTGGPTSESRSEINSMANMTGAG